MILFLSFCEEIHLHQAQPVNPKRIDPGKTVVD